MITGFPSRRKQERGTAARVAALAAAVTAVALALSACGSTPSTVESVGNVGAGGSPGVVSRAVADDLARSAQAAMKKNRIEGMAIAVVADDGSSWSAGFGSAGGGRSVTPATPFLLASVTKVFTAAAVMQLAEEGRVDLDKPIGTYVPEMAGRQYPGSRPPTVRDLLTHHGGVVSDVLKGNLYDGPQSGYTQAFMRSIPLIAELPMTEPPGTLAHYSNVGYLLLGALVADVSGLPYADFVRTRILEPLGMRDSGFLDPASSAALSAGFSSGRQVPTPRLAGGPEGGLAASAADLGRFMSMIIAGTGNPRGAVALPVLSAAGLREMLSQQNRGVALDFDYEMGLGFNLMRLPGRPDVRVAWKDGGSSPFASMLVVAPDDGVGAVVLSNSNETVPYELAFEAVERVIRERRGAAPTEPAGHRFAQMAGRPLQPDELAGVYASEIGAIVVGGTPGDLQATIPGARVWMVRREQESYGLQAKLLGLIPLSIPDLDRLRIVFREIDGRRVLAIYESGLFRSVALQVEPRPVSPAWQARLGHYVVADPDPTPFVLGADLGFDQRLGFMTISVTVATTPRPFVMPVLVQDDQTLVSAGLGRRMGEQFRVQSSDGREVILWGGLTLQRQQDAATPYLGGITVVPAGAATGDCSAPGQKEARQGADR
jgi:CubicO group peptidase (beta-lactamase class C family)